MDKKGMDDRFGGGGMHHHEEVNQGKWKRDVLQKPNFYTVFSLLGQQYMVPSYQDSHLPVAPPRPPNMPPHPPMMPEEDERHYGEAIKRKILLAYQAGFSLDEIKRSLGLHVNRKCEKRRLFNLPGKIN